MKKVLLIILSIAAFVGGFIIFYPSRPAEQKTPAANQTSQETSTQNWPSKIDEQGRVSVKITPQVLDGAQWKFEIVFDTHSGSLDDDLLQVVLLVDAKGNTYQPTAWEGAGPGGHHREGILIFNAVIPTPPSVELKIRNVGEVLERSFKWSTE